MRGADMGIYVPDVRTDLNPGDSTAVTKKAVVPQDQTEATDQTINMGEFDRRYLEVFGNLPPGATVPTDASGNRGTGGRATEKADASRKNPVASQAIRHPVRDTSRRHGRKSTRRGGPRSNRRSSSKHRSHGRRRRSRARSARRSPMSLQILGRGRRGPSEPRARSIHASMARRRPRSRPLGSHQNRRQSPNSTERSEALSLALFSAIWPGNKLSYPSRARASGQRTGRLWSVVTLRSIPSEIWVAGKGASSWKSQSPRHELAAVID